MSGDVAATAARALGVETIETPAFQPLDAATLADLEERLDRVDAAVFAGAGEAFDPVIDALAADRTVVAVEEAVADGPRPLERFREGRTTSLEALPDTLADVGDTDDGKSIATGAP